MKTAGSCRIVQFICMILIIIVASNALVASEIPMKFNCGKARASTSSEYIPLSGQEIYTAARGYGWLKPWGYDSYRSSSEKPIINSFIDAKECVDTHPEENDVTFRIDVANGTYMVTVWVGAESSREGRLGICLAVNDRTVIPSPGIGGWGKVIKRTVPAVVENNTLELNFFVVGHGGAARLSIMGFAIEPVTTQIQQTALQKKWMACGAKEDQPRQITIDKQIYTEVGRLNEKPLNPLGETWQNSSLLTFVRSSPGDLLDYTIPKAEELCRQLSSFAAPSEDQPVWFGIHALHDLSDIYVSCSDLTGTSGHIPADQIEIFTLTTRPRSMTDRSGSMVKLAADLLDQNAPFDIPKNKTQAVYLRIHIPKKTMAGVYSGTVTITPDNADKVELPLVIRVLPIELQTPPDKVWNLFADPIRWVGMSQTESRAEIDDMMRHGINSLSVSYPPFGVSYIERNGRIVDADYGKTGDILRYAAKVGITGPVLIGSTSGIFLRLCGWNIDQKGDASYDFITEQDNRSVHIKHADTKTRSSVYQIIGSLLKPGATVELTVRYRTIGSGSASVNLTFMKTHKRGAVKTSMISEKLPPSTDWKTLKTSTCVPQQAPYGRATINFSGGSGSIIIDHVSLTTDEEVRNHIINPGFERDIEIPSEETAVWSKSFMRDYVDAISALGRAIKRTGQIPWIVGTDEANGTPRELNEMCGAKQAGLPTYCNLNPSAISKAGDTLDVICLYTTFLGTEQNCHKLLTQYHNRNQKLYFIASGAYVGQEFDFMPNRHNVGLCFWKSRADGTSIWTFQRFNGDPFNDLDGAYKDYCMVFPPRNPGGHPVPTLGWEGIREGWRDFQYIYTLEQVTRKAEKEGQEKAAKVGREILAFINNAVPWFDQGDGIGYGNDSANRLRWLAAWAIMKIQKQNTSYAPSDRSINGSALDVMFSSSPHSPVISPLLCPETFTPPLIDGSLNDSVWNTAVRIKELHNYLTGASAKQQTEVFFQHDRSNLYIGLRCFEPAIEQLKTVAQEHDSYVFNDDSIEIFIDTQNDAFNFLHLAFNTIGTRFDQRCAGNNHVGANVFGANYKKQKIRDTSWNGKWTVKTSLHTNRWEAEIVLPFKTIGRKSDLWGLNICRNRRAQKQETSAWRAYGSFHQPEKFGKLLLAGGRTGTSSILHIDQPFNRFGYEVAKLSINSKQKITGYAELILKDGQIEYFNGTTTNNLVSIPYVLKEDSASLNYTIKDNDIVLHHLQMPIKVPPPIDIKRAQKVLFSDSPQGMMQLSIQVSEQERYTRSFCATLYDQNGKSISKVNAPLKGNICTVSLNMTNYPYGKYTILCELTGPNGSIDIKRSDTIILVPPYLPNNL